MKNYFYLSLALVLLSINVLAPQLSFFTNLFLPLYLVLFLEEEGGIKNLYIKYLVLFCLIIAIGFLDLRIGFNLFFMTGIPALFLFLRYRLNKFKSEPLIYAPLPAFFITIGVILFLLIKGNFSCSILRKILMML